MKKMLSFLIVALLILSACKSQGTIDFENNLAQIYENLRISIQNGRADFVKYNLKYTPTSLFTVPEITLENINEMKEIEDDIKKYVSDFDKDSGLYSSLRAGADVESLSDASKKLDINIGIRVSYFQSITDNVGVCINNVVRYRTFVELARFNSVKLKEFAAKSDVINTYIDDEEYADAFAEIENLTEIVLEIKENDLVRSELGILRFSENALKSWDVYLDSLDELKKYIQYLEARDYAAADLQYAKYMTVYSKSISLGLDEGQSISLDDLDLWYQENIAVCADYFKQDNSDLHKDFYT